MDELERRIRRRLRDDYPHYSKKCLKIRTKDGSIEPFQLNKVQEYLHGRVEQQRRETGKVRAVILKGRQQGISTYIEGRYYHAVTHNFGMRAFILTHDIDATNNLFEMARRYHDNCPDVVRPTVEKSNAKELIFSGLDSGYKLGTAGNKGVGRSSTIQLFHGSEVALWPNAYEHAKGIMQAIPKLPGTEIFLESTARGVSNYFHDQWQMAEAGETDFIPIFIPWFWQDEYKESVGDDFICDDEELELVHFYNLSPEQIKWRRSKINEFGRKGFDGLKFFMQEYPCTPVEAFQRTGDDSFILPQTVMAARRCTAEPYGNLVVGVDPAWMGDDRTSIIRRQGRVSYGLESYIKKDTMEVVGIINRIIINEKPAKVCVDVGGLGAGICDRLKELGHRSILVPVNGGCVALDDRRYVNKRAEMWGLMKEWLLDLPCQIPDNDSLHADLCAVNYKIDSNSRTQLEKKEDMKRRGIRSPDEGDALALTFALPDFALMESKNQEYKTIAQSLANASNRIDRLKKAAYK